MGFTTTETGCIVPVHKSLNQDGYYRCKIKGTLVMYHRYVWEKKYGAIPKGYEIHHTCHNRACCNIDHLQLLERTTHLVLTNKTRYAGRHQKAKEYWTKYHCSGIELSKVFNVSFSSTCRWIRGWKA